MFYLNVGTDVQKYEGKDAAIAAGYEQQEAGGSDVWTVEDADGFVVYQEFPPPRWM